MRSKFTLLQEAISLMGNLLTAQSLYISINNKTRRKLVCETQQLPNGTYLLRLHPQFGNWAEPQYIECEAGTSIALPYQFKEDFHRTINIPEGFLTDLNTNPSRASIVDGIQQRLALVSTFSGVSMSLDNLTGGDIFVKTQQSSNGSYEIVVTTEDQVEPKDETYKKMGNERINFAITLQT